MKVVLLAKVPALGERGDICEVADGYARNLLFPKNLARSATTHAITEAREEHDVLQKHAEQELVAAQHLASRLDGYELEFEEKVSEAGTLYAAVGTQKTAQELKQRGFDIKKTQITMKPIKTPGEYQATIRLDHGLEAEIKIIVAEAL